MLREDDEGTLAWEYLINAWNGLIIGIISIMA